MTSKRLKEIIAEFQEVYQENKEIYENLHEQLDLGWCEAMEYVIDQLKEGV